MDNGVEIMDYLHNIKPDESGSRVFPRFILLDLNMPNMDGFEFIETMRTDPRWQDVPVVVLTAVR